ncbi:LysR family transcriptional regulator [Bradyrhizobium sp. SSBR45G]|uniref:LysR family transcriptional regulator n=1 Tax=unclassified Bradyrhizobium TaxID=2631580 RepID=UPI002342AEC3|nr:MULTISPECIES: LysR family transcriptional regulator [unclassified Bradyrhizobium]GLH82459.1 LysR family transcriptional regulator [Bradyrhizobium sp. SSBR45G]GLH89892.1 LysR family transcriptional regulator [Bradyrhizobium sp. SSBR45R]
MTFEQMRIFLEAAHFGSFTHAAEQLGLTQSAVSVSIKKLEEKLDVPLFDRSGRRLMLTEAGQVLLNEAERILRDVELTMRRVEGRRPLAQSALVACTASAYDFWMPQMLARESGAGVQGVDLIRGSVNEVTAYVMRGTADAGVTSAMPSHPQFQQVAVFADRLILCGHPERARQVPDDLGWKALGEQVPLLWEHGELTATLAAVLASHRLDPDRLAHPVLKLASSMAVISALLGGRYIGFVSDRAAQPWLSAGRLVRIGTLEIPVRYWLFGLREHNIDRFVSLFGGRAD